MEYIDLAPEQVDTPLRRGVVEKTGARRVIR